MLRRARKVLSTQISCSRGEGIRANMLSQAGTVGGERVGEGGFWEEVVFEGRACWRGEQRRKAAWKALQVWRACRAQERECYNCVSMERLGGGDGKPGLGAWQRQVGKFCCCSAARSCPIHFDPMDCSPPGSSVLHCLPEFTQIHIQQVSDAI